MTIIDKLEESLVKYLEKPCRDWPECIYLGEDECTELDNYCGGIVDHVFHCEVVMVMKLQWLSFGDK